MSTTDAHVPPATNNIAAAAKSARIFRIMITSIWTSVSNKANIRISCQILGIIGEKDDGGTIPLDAQMHWTRRFRIGTRTGLGTIMGSALFRAVLRLQSRGEIGAAYRVALWAERIAVRQGNQQQAQTAKLAISGMVPHVAYSAASLIESLQHGARLAVAKEAWKEALKHVETILALDPQDVRIRGRALRNRATLLTTLGRFQDAVLSYARLQEDQEVWANMTRNYQVGFESSRAICEWYLGKVQLGALTGVTPHLAGAPATWKNYWWVLAHIAWRDRPSRLLSVRKSSLRTFDPSWSYHVDSVLWGIDLLVGPQGQGTGLELRVGNALNNPDTVQHIGRSSWLDLYGDWLRYHWIHDPERAQSMTANHVVWCASHGYDGWASYLQSQMAPRLS